MTETPKPLILIVDDEEMVAISLRNLFRLQSDFQVMIHTSPLQALSAGGSVPVDLVITDYLMPEMDGITFLGRFKETQPQAIRILLTAYADKENAIRAINTVGLYHYVEKPWDNAMLMTVVKNGLEKRSLIRALEAKISELDQAQASLKSLKNEVIRAFM